MKKNVILAAAMLAAFASTAQAEESKGKIGLGSYVVSATDITGASVTYKGAALTGGYNFTDIFSINAHAYSLTHELTTALTLKGTDITVRAGHNGNGFTYFGGLGLFNETLTGTLGPFSASQGYSGGLVSFGLGYNWDKVSQEWEGAIRDGQAYKDVSGKDTAAINSSLNVAYRF